MDGEKTNIKLSEETGSKTAIQKIAQTNPEIVKTCPAWTWEIYNECRVKVGLKPVEFEVKKQ